MCVGKRFNRRDWPAQRLGDSIHTFACSHCFHKTCVNKWIAHRCLDNCEEGSFNCPECRQDHVTLSEAGSSVTSLAEGISSLSFMQVGEGLGARDIGYDFLSDLGSELASIPPASPRVLLSVPSTPNRILVLSRGKGSTCRLADIAVAASPGPLRLRSCSSENMLSTGRLTEPSSPASAASIAEIDDDLLNELQSPIEQGLRAGRMPVHLGPPSSMMLGIAGMRRFGVARSSLLSRGPGGGLFMPGTFVPFLGMLPPQPEHRSDHLYRVTSLSGTEAARPLSPIAEGTAADSSIEEAEAPVSIPISVPVIQSVSVDTREQVLHDIEEHCLNESTYSDCGIPLFRK